MTNDYRVNIRHVFSKELLILYNLINDIFLCFYKIPNIGTESGQTFKEILTSTSKSWKPYLGMLNSEFFPGMSEFTAAQVVFIIKVLWPVSGPANDWTSGCQSGCKLEHLENFKMNWCPGLTLRFWFNKSVLALNIGIFKKQECKC